MMIHIYTMIYFFFFDSMDIYKSVNMNCVTVMKNPEMLKFVPNHYKTWKMCDKAVNTYLSTIEFGLEYIMTQEVSNKAVNR